MNRLLKFMILSLVVTVTGCQKKEEPSPLKTSSEEVQKSTTEGNVAKAGKLNQGRNEFVR
ncbi:hypothetical protein EDC63_101367 [Sulfurirhabdus autotrophica]|uniref:Lipoprotein n=1 Tax=Sulfurirhabdus autotrophica TaxID=1706046 RepID=A0A4R3YD49_9PROT|nr:hypothetical protein EDC63_101367 [Sulfurirhabdus autotrophica]